MAGRTDSQRGMSAVFLEPEVGIELLGNAEEHEIALASSFLT